MVLTMPRRATDRYPKPGFPSRARRILPFLPATALPAAFIFGALYTSGTIRMDPDEYALGFTLTTACGCMSLHKALLNARFNGKRANRSTLHCLSNYLWGAIGTLAVALLTHRFRPLPIDLLTLSISLIAVATTLKMTAHSIEACAQHALDCIVHTPDTIETMSPGTLLATAARTREEAAALEALAAYREAHPGP